MSVCVRSTELVDERIDGVILALDGCGWMTRRQLIEKMSRMILVEPYHYAHLDYTLMRMRLKGVVECRRVRTHYGVYEYRLRGPS